MSRIKGQGWVLDTLLGLGGWDVLHPDVRSFFEELGYYHSDVDEVFARVKSGAMLPKAWSEVAEAVERKARWYDDEGYALTAGDLYRRASVLWGRAQYSFFADDPRRQAFRERTRDCVDALIRVSPYPIERVELDFDGGTIYGLLHRPANTAGPVPVVILGPGMDMVKEDYSLVAQRNYVSRGVAALAIEGPGQGETLSSGVKVDLTNYERAMSRFVDDLAARQEIAADKIGLWGQSMGSYWGLRCAAHDHRLNAVATAAGCYGSFDVIFGRAQPNFKANFMYMSGYEDEAAFDREVMANMHLWDLVDDIQCPVFLGFGEFDELTRIEDTLLLFDRIPGPKELCVFEQEFHPLGPVTAELFRYGSEWLARAAAGALPADLRAERYMRRDGVVVPDAAPDWWRGARPQDLRAIELGFGSDSRSTVTPADQGATP